MPYFTRRRENINQQKMSLSTSKRLAASTGGQNFEPNLYTTPGKQQKGRESDTIKSMNYCPKTSYNMILLGGESQLL